MEASFQEKKQQYDSFDFAAFLAAVTVDDVRAVLTKPRLDELDYLALLAPAAQGCLEEIAQRAHAETVRNFGYAMQLFTPMYISDYCDNLCIYCGFNHQNVFERHRLDEAQLRREAAAIAATGLRNVLVLTGESQTHSPVEYIADAVTVLHDYFDTVSIEIYALSEADYGRMIAAGVDGMTMFQECYDPAVYKTLHLAGPKSIYAYRLDAPERACRAGMRNVNIGALLGLNEWRQEAFFTGLHADYLQHKYKSTEIAVSTPRIRPCAAGYAPACLVDDAQLTQYIMALRLYLPRAGITLSTREAPFLRDHLIKLGVTKISGGVSVAVGGHTQEDEGDQFSISDTRTIYEMAQMLYKAGYQPIYKDWQKI